MVASSPYLSNLFRILLTVCLVSSCSSGPATQILINPPADSAPARATRREAGKGFQLKTVHAEEPPAPELEEVAQAPANPGLELRFQTGTAIPGSVRIPEQGAFSLRVEASSDTAFHVIDADASDGLAVVQVPQTFDLYFQADPPALPPMCPPGGGSTASVPDQMDQLVLAKISSLVAQGKGQCTYQPPNGQRQNANCNSTSSGFQCSGPLNKTISATTCPEIAIYAGAMNLNNAFPNNKLFVAIQNNLTINQSAKGVLATRGSLNTSLNGSSQLEGVFVGGSSNNLNLSSTARVKGLYTLVNSSALGGNFNNSAVFEGALCATGTFNLNRTSGSQTIYRPDVLTPWGADVPNLPNLICAPRSNFYTQSVPLNCTPPASTASLQVIDALYGLGQSVTSNADGRWYRATGRPAAVPSDWASTDGTSYMLRFENHGTAAFSTRWYTQAGSARVPGSVRIVPAVDCISPHPQGGSTAYLSYTSLMASQVTLAAGASNRILPDGTSQNQPIQFAPGQSSVFPNSTTAIHFQGPELSWTVGARTVSAQASDPALQCPEVIQSPDLLISDVQLTDSGVSLQGKDAPGSIEPDFAGRDIFLTLKGTFKDYQDQPLNLAEFLFTLAPPLIQQTFIGTEPTARILLDDSILLETTAVSGAEIQAILHTEKLPDLYLKGLHKLSVEQGEWYTDTLIQVGEPVPPTGSLGPEVDSVEVMRDQQGIPLHLRLTGRHFMVYPKFSYTLIDGAFGFGFQTEVTMDGVSCTIVHIPNPETFDSRTHHLVIMATPFGVALKEF